VTLQLSWRARGLAPIVQFCARGSLGDQPSAGTSGSGFCGLIVAVYFRIPDSEPVLAGHYGKPHMTLPASQAARVIAEADTPLGYEVGRCPGPGPRGDAGASRAPPGARRAAGQG